MPPKPRITHDQAKRLIIQWHLMGLQWVPPEGISHDEGPSEEIPEEDGLDSLEDR